MLTFVLNFFFLSLTIFQILLFIPLFILRISLSIQWTIWIVGAVHVMAVYPGECPSSVLHSLSTCVVATQQWEEENNNCVPFFHCHISSATDRTWNFECSDHVVLPPTPVSSRTFRGRWIERETVASVRSSMLVLIEINCNWVFNLLLLKSFILCAKIFAIKQQKQRHMRWSEFTEGRKKCHWWQRRESSTSLLRLFVYLLRSRRDESWSSDETQNFFSCSTAGCCRTMRHSAEHIISRNVIQSRLSLMWRGKKCVEICTKKNL